MWKPLALASLLTLPAAAQDVGAPVSFSAPGSFDFLSSPGGVAFDSGESHALPEAWDSIILQGDSADPGLRFEVRRRLPAGGWSAWKTALIKRHPGGRFWARAHLPPARPGTVQVRAVGGSSAASATAIYSLDAYASTDVEARGAVAVATAPARAPVHGREEWGAKPPKEPFSAHVPKRLTFHHTAGRRTSTLQESLDEVRFIQDFHQNGRGWNDIGYHYLIDTAGRVFQGRPENVSGAHVRGGNSGNVGVSLMAYHHEPKLDPLVPEELASLQALLLALSIDYGIPAEELRGHRDFGSGTSCPGDLAYVKREELRETLRKGPPPNPAIPGVGPVVKKPLFTGL